MINCPGSLITDVIRLAEKRTLQVRPIIQFLRRLACFGLFLPVVLLASCRSDLTQTTTEKIPRSFPPNLDSETISLDNPDWKTWVHLYYDERKIHLIQIIAVNQTDLTTEVHGHSIASLVYTNGDKVICPLRPDGTPLPPSDETVVTETRDDNWTETTILLTQNQWKTFLATDPTRCSVEILKELAKAGPEIAE